MIAEDHVSFEVAKLLKKKGFKEECYLHYSSNGKMQHWNYQSPIDGISAPTLQMTMKWLRETFEIHCQIDCPIVAFNWRYGIRDLDKDEWVTLRDMGDYDTYEEACEAAIKYCLENLI